MHRLHPDVELPQPERRRGPGRPPTNPFHLRYIPPRQPQSNVFDFPEQNISPPQPHYNPLDSQEHDIPPLFSGNFRTWGMGIFVLGTYVMGSFVMVIMRLGRSNNSQLFMHFGIIFEINIKKQVKFKP